MTRSSPRAWMLRASAGVLAVSVAAPPTGAAEGVDQPIMTNKAGQQSVAASDRFLAWDQNTRRRPGHYDAYLKRKGGGGRRRLNRAGSEGILGGIFAGRVAYQQFNGSPGDGRSDIKLYKITTGKRREPRGVNTRAWEYIPSIFGRWLLFARTNVARGTDAVLLRNLKRGRTRALDRGNTRTFFQPGQVNGHFATWLTWRPGNRARVYRHDIQSGNTRKVPNSGSYDWAPSVTQRGTVYFGRTGRRCGSNARLMRWKPGSSPQEIVDFPRRIDISDSYVHTTPQGNVHVYHNRLRCRNLSTGGDLYRYIDPFTKTLRVVKDGNGEGRVTSQHGGVNCGSDCRQDYEPGQKVTLRANPADGSRFDEWSGAPCGSSRRCTFRMSSNRTVTATFRRGGS